MNQIPNSFKKILFEGDIHAATDVFKIILMDSSFVFDKDAHHCYADVIAHELSNGLGYTTGGITLTGVTLTVNNTADRAELTWNDVNWDATGGALVASGAVIYDDTTATGSGHDYTDAIVSYKDGNGDLIALDGTPLRIQDIMETIS